MPRFGPMGAGLETDMESGEPIIPREMQKQAQQEERRLRTIERHAQLIHDIAGDGGIVLQRVAAKLIARIDYLVEQDPQAYTLLSLLRDTQHALAVGERYVQVDLEQVLRRDGLIGP